MTKSTEAWRNNPERRQAAQELHDRWMRHARSVITLLQTADKEFNEADLDWDDSTAKMLREAHGHLRNALYRAQTAHGPATGTYIGNMSAFGVGTDRDYRKNNPSTHQCMDEWFDD